VPSRRRNGPSQGASETRFEAALACPERPCSTLPFTPQPQPDSIRIGSTQAIADTPSDDIPSEDAPGEDAPESLPDASGNEAVPKEDVPEEAVARGTFADEAVADEAVASGAFADEAFAEDIAGAEDFSEKALSERTRRAYRRAWADFEEYCEEVGREALPARPVTVAAYLNGRARARPTGRGAPKERSGEGLAASTLKQRLAGIKRVHESSGYPSPTTHPQVSQVMQGIRNDTGCWGALYEPLPYIEHEQRLEEISDGEEAPDDKTAVADRA
jgi:hypothetical protein